jgi:hypothetical protein
VEVFFKLGHNCNILLKLRIHIVSCFSYPPPLLAHPHCRRNILFNNPNGQILMTLLARFKHLHTHRKKQNTRTLNAFSSSINLIVKGKPSRSQHWCCCFVQHKCWAKEQTDFFRANKNFVFSRPNQKQQQSKQNTTLLCNLYGR